jgi:hypothetical protein
MAYERNLVLVHTPHLQARSDFETIKAKIATRAPDIEVFIVNNRTPNSVSRRQAARRPSLVFSPVKLGRFAPLRGKIYAGGRYNKLTELRMMTEAGINIPKTHLIEPDTVLDEAEWGPFVVVKPRTGMQGMGVRLRRTRDVRWVDPEAWPSDDDRHGRQMMAQQFVDTGPLTACYRVFTVLGRCAYSSISRLEQPRTFVLDPDSEEPFDEPIAANIAARNIVLNFEKDVIAFGEDVHRAFPGVAALGVDVVRDARTGELFALEVNAPGITWHISSDYGMAIQRKYGIDYQRQLNALDVIADALIDRTRREAE